MGTTRAHDDPRQGVVDAHGKVHGMANLFVAGASVFPTGGATSPTATILALTLRLATHLKALSLGRITHMEERSPSTEATRLGLLVTDKSDGSWRQPHARIRLGALRQGRAAPLSPADHP
jgi:hypothetical protein